jgi:hypothetical protein
MFKFFLFLVLSVSLFAGQAHATFTFKRSSSCQSTGGIGAPCTSTNADYTGVDLIIAVVGYTDAASGTCGVVQDSSSNTWTTLHTSAANSGEHLDWYYVQAPTVTATMNFTTNCSPGGANGTYPGLAVLGFAGSIATPQDQKSIGASAGTVTSLQGGNVTPGVSLELIVSAWMAGGTPTSLSIDSGFTLQVNQPGTSVATGASIAYIIETSIAAKNPTWSWTTAETSIVANATFKTSGGVGGGGALSTRMLMGVGQ